MNISFINLSVLIAIAFLSGPKICTGVFQYALPVLSEKMQEIGWAANQDNVEPTELQKKKFMKLFQNYINMRSNTHIVGKREQQLNEKSFGGDMKTLARIHLLDIISNRIMDASFDDY